MREWGDRGERETEVGGEGGSMREKDVGVGEKEGQR